MPTIVSKIKVNQPPEITAAAFLDPDNAVYWTTHLERFEIISGKPGQVGSVAHLHYLEEGRAYILVDVLEEIVPNQYFKSRVSGGGLNVQVETRLQNDEGSTLISIRWAATGSTLVMRILLPFLRGRIARHTMRELQAFKQLVETHGAHFSS
jgi:hypothetical protein